MARKRSSHGKSDVKTKAAAAPGSKIKKIEKYEDTIEEGGVDDCMSNSSPQALMV